MTSFISEQTCVGKNSKLYTPKRTEQIIYFAQWLSCKMLVCSYAVIFNNNSQECLGKVIEETDPVSYKYFEGVEIMAFVILFYFYRILDSSGEEFTH